MLFLALEWRRQWQPTPVLLPGKSHGQRSLVGCSPWGHEESDTTERLRRVAAKLTKITLLSTTFSYHIGRARCFTCLSYLVGLSERSSLSVLHTPDPGLKESQEMWATLLWFNTQAGAGKQSWLKNTLLLDSKGINKILPLGINKTGFFNISCIFSSL